MRSKKNIRYIKYIIMLLTLSVSMVFLIPCRNIKAYSNNNYEDVIIIFTGNSIDYKLSELEFQKNIFAKNEYQHMLDRYGEQIVKAQGDADTLENLTIEYEDSLLQLNLYTYYEENREKWIEENYRIQKYHFISDYLQLPVLRAKIDYSKAVLNELNEIMNIIEVQFDLGYATTLDLDNIQTQIITEEASLKTTEGDFNLLHQQIYEELGKTNIDILALNKVQGLKTQEEYVQNFYNNNTTLQYLQTQVKSYSTYKEDMETKGEAYEKYVLKADNELQILNLKIQKYESDLSINILKSLISYQSASSQLEAKEKEIENLKLKIKNKQYLYRKGKVQKIELTKLNTNMVKLSSEREYILYKQNIAYYELFYSIDQNSIIG